MCDFCKDKSDAFKLGDKVACSRCASKAAFELAELNEVLKHQIDIHKDEICDLRNELSRLRAGMAPI